MSVETLRDMHHNGVHTHCKAPTGKGRIVDSTGHHRGDGTHRACHLHGRVERFHGHDFEGPLWAACGCEEGI